MQYRAYSLSQAVLATASGVSGQASKASKLAIATGLVLGLVALVVGIGRLQLVGLLLLPWGPPT